MSSSPGKITLTSLPRLSCRFSPLHHRQQGLSRLATIPPPPPPPPVCIHICGSTLKCQCHGRNSLIPFSFWYYSFFLLLSRKERTGCGVNVFLYQSTTGQLNVNKRIDTALFVCVCVSCGNTFYL